MCYSTLLANNGLSPRDIQGFKFSMHGKNEAMAKILRKKRGKSKPERGELAWLSVAVEASRD